MSHFSTYQQACIKDAREGFGHTAIEAFAGAGKSTTAEEMICVTPGGLRVLVCAFNKEIELAFKERLPRILTRRPDLAENNRLEVKTVCALGFAICRFNFKGVKLNEFKSHDKARELVPGDELKEYRSDLVRIVGLAKGALIRDHKHAFMLARDDFDMDLALKRSGFDPEKPALDKQEQYARERASLETVARDIIALMNASMADTTQVDFDDMWWLPLVIPNIKAWGYDRVICDEFQDMSYAQFQLLRKVCKWKGRMFVIGDSFQVIYTFRGGRTDMLDIFCREMRAKKLPLHITYRCDKSIVDVAKTIVEDFQARPGAPDGLVQEVQTEEYEDVYELARPGDFVISRANAPLLKLCIGFMRRGTPALVRGHKDVAEVFLSMIERSKAKTTEKLLTWVDKWEAREIKRLTRKNPDADTSVASDTAEAIRTLAEDVREVSEIRSKIELLFTDGDDSRRVVLTSTHKAKGLERDRCVLLADTYRPYHGGEEARLWYVAITRARHELFLVRNAKKKDRDM